MIPNDFGIIRQADHNLLACLYTSMLDISEYEYEIIYPEYVENFYIDSSGVAVSETGACYGTYDVSNYDYVLFPCINRVTASPRFSALTAGIGNSMVTRSISVRGKDPLVTGWVIEEVLVPYNILIINSDINFKLPFIGFRRHRSDGANPKGIINPLPEPDPDLKKDALDEVDPYPEKALEEVDPYPEDN